MAKNGQIWISAVLYIALGVVAITIVLSAGVPIINKLKDKNVIVQTKNILLSLDNTIREVRDEGPGSRRVINPFVIKSGSLFIKPEENKPNDNMIVWDMKTSAVFVELCGKTKKDCEDADLIIKEGPVLMYETTTIVENEYIMHLELNYENIALLDLTSDTGKNAPLLGKYNLKIENAGINDKRTPQTNLPDILIKIT